MPVHLSILISVYSSITELGPDKKLFIHKYSFSVWDLMFYMVNEKYNFDS